MALLLSRPNQVVGRSELFDEVWPNQVVSEDALTRCVSDIRGQLKHLSGREDWIETLPKRGYRWLGEVGETTAADSRPEAGNAAAEAAADPAADPAADAGEAAADGSIRAAGRGADRLPKAVRLAGRGLAYLVALVAMASLIVWTIDRFAGPGAPVVAVLPVAAEPAQAELAAALDLALVSNLMRVERIRVLARSAIESRPPNPFPFFYYEFGARWLVESELRTVAGHAVLTIDVVDARTGIVEMQYSERLAAAGAADVDLPAGARESLERFVAAELVR